CNLGLRPRYANELMDAIILSKDVCSYPELSRCPVFRRGWPSIYGAMKGTRPNTTLIDGTVH
ncbi:MAG: hypothetical protein F6K26_48285, partial [Moorea sp. SIO2I5]|nr:hypothetical protein [Moorena sp. SIO2I5]